MGYQTWVTQSGRLLRKAVWSLSPATADLVHLFSNQCWSNETDVGEGCVGEVEAIGEKPSQMIRTLCNVLTEGGSSSVLDG